MSKKTEQAVVRAAMRMFNSRSTRMNERAGNCDYLGMYYILRDTGVVRLFTRACRAHAKATKKGRK